MHKKHSSADILIVGSGLMGAAVARQVRLAHPGARIVMVDGGSTIGSIRGQHLHDTPEPEIWKRYNAEVESGIQSLYVGAETSRDIGDTVADADPGMYNLAAFGERAEAMPASAVAWNVGGMGVHWTAATPWPAGDEVFDHGDPERWEADLETAREILRVHSAPFPPSLPGAAVLARLEALFADSSVPGRHPQTMPMAVEPVTSGTTPRTGPNRIFPAIRTGADPNFELLEATLAVELVHDGATVVGVRVRDVTTGTERVIAAHSTVVCADTMRTPQLLFASGIRMPALGRYLNEHAFLTGQVLVDLDRLGLTLADLPRRRTGEWFADSLWIPQNGDAQPFHGQIMNSVFVDEDEAPLAYSFGMSLYVPNEIRAENRLVFSETEADAAGLPLISVEFTYSARDRALIDDARAIMKRTAEAFGPFDPQADSMLLAPGSSLHYTGTVRMGEADDGTSVCDPEGRVWGFDNLYVAGNGVVPTAVVCNSTLTGMITAVRAARAVSRRFESVRA